MNELIYKVKILFKTVNLYPNEKIDNFYQDAIYSQKNTVYKQRDKSKKINKKFNF